MKCPNCGNKSFAKVELYTSYILATSGDISPNAEFYACEKCGRVEIYMPENWVQENLNKKKAVEDEKNFEIEKAKKIELINNAILRLEEIVNDENQTIKTVKEAKAELEELKKELVKVEHSQFPKKQKGSVFGG